MEKRLVKTVCMVTRIILHIVMSYCFYARVDDVTSRNGMNRVFGILCSLCVCVWVCGVWVSLCICVCVCVYLCVCVPVYLCA